ncbi:MAG TPA: hypothetical protein VJT73_13600, partial [Polyangiaceae bacterium]|nr:hypothetical protein [Polyangiaceae bacterium]
DASQSPDSSVACFAEEAADAGEPGLDAICKGLPYAAVVCPADAAGDTRPVGVQVCDHLFKLGDLKASAAKEIGDCLKALANGPGACTKEHDDAADVCSRTLFARSACTVPSETIDGGSSAGCAQIVATCADGGAPVKLEDCNRLLGPWSKSTRRDMIECYFDPDTADPGTSCAEKFESNCVDPL